MYAAVPALGILGAPHEAYARYAQQVRAEYSHVPGLLYNRGRADFLAGCLKRERLFFSEVYHDELEAAARANLRWELATQLGRAGRKRLRL